MFIFSLDYEMWSVLLFLFCFIRFVFDTHMFIFSLDYEVWSVLLFLFCFMHFVFVTQMFIFSLDYEMWSVLLFLNTSSKIKIIKQTTFHNQEKR
jgi:hypothetical protein